MSSSEQVVGGGCERQFDRVVGFLPRPETMRLALAALDESINRRQQALQNPRCKQARLVRNDLQRDLMRRDWITALVRPRGVLH